MTDKDSEQKKIDHYVVRLREATKFDLPSKTIDDIHDAADFIEALNFPAETVMRRNAARYEFLRNDDNWIDDGDQWAILGESSFSQFDQIVDEQMSRAATEKMKANP